MVICILEKQSFHFKIIRKKKKIKGIKVVFMFYLCYFMLILCDYDLYNKGLANA